MSRNKYLCRICHVYRISQNYIVKSINIKNRNKIAPDSPNLDSYFRILYFLKMRAQPAHSAQSKPMDISRIHITANSLSINLPKSFNEIYPK